MKVDKGFTNCDVASLELSEFSAKDLCIIFNDLRDGISPEFHKTFVFGLAHKEGMGLVFVQYKDFDTFIKDKEGYFPQIRLGLSLKNNSFELSYFNIVKEKGASFEAIESY